MKAKEQPNVVDPIETDGQVEQAFEFLPIDHHEWIQEGNMLKCTSCAFPHGATIAQGMVLSKNAEGKFVLTKEY